MKALLNQQSFTKKHHITVITKLQMNLSLRIEGKNPISGEIKISSSKNACLALLAASILNKGHTKIVDVPGLLDVDNLIKIIKSFGVAIDYEPENKSITIDACHISNDSAPYQLVSKLRASFFVIGPLLARIGTAQIPLPGGCSIGSRPIDLHLKGLKSLGAEISINHGVVHAKAQKLTGSTIVLDFPSVGATQTILMASCLAEGETIIENAAQEPEVFDLINFCRSLGVKIKTEFPGIIQISGQQSIKTDIEYKPIPDRMEAGTFIAMSAITGCSLSLSSVIPKHLESVLAKFCEMGLNFSTGHDFIHINPISELKPVKVTTSVFPGFPTDLQSPIAASLVIANGPSIVQENIFENRFLYIPELCRLGAQIELRENQATIFGSSKLSAAPIEAKDLRGAAALVVAALAAEGTTEISQIQHLMRGYENIIDRFRSIGIKAELVEVNNANQGSASV